MRNLPGIKRSFAELSLVGKMTYIGTTLSATVGTVLALWQGFAWGNDRFEAKMADVVKENAYSAVEVQVDNKLASVQRQNQVYYLMGQIGIKQLELRSVETEIRTVTRDSTSLTPAQETQIEQLQRDRTQIKTEIEALHSQLGNVNSAQ